VGAAGRFARLLGQGLSLAIGRRPDRRLELASFGAFVGAWALATSIFALQDFLSTPAPREFDAFAPWGHAGVGAALLLIGWLVARVLRRPAAWLTLAALAAVAMAPWSVLDLRLQATLGPAAEPARIAVATLLCVLAARIAWVAGADAPRLRRLSAGALFALLLLVPWQARAQLWLWYTTADAGDETAYGPPVLVRDPEALLGRQPELVRDRIARLAPQVPGRVDLYAVGFAGDGNEGVFRNEVDYLQALLAQRFGAGGRVLPLVNHPDTIATTPIASLTNLRAALAGIGHTMDREEDVLLLFLTSHGTREHELVVDFPPLPLRQVAPKDLKDALDAAGIRWRVVVVSACYSGGFVDALRTPETLVITAARADRTSFGCGSDAQITYFGKAFLAQGLNQTTDLREAYAVAAKLVAGWERADDETPSLPQLWAGERIDAKLAQWRAGLAPGAAVPFEPAMRRAPQAAR
jgi:hypothetical protein